MVDSRATVLLVEDDDDSAELLTSYVERSGCLVVRVGTAEAAVQQLDRTTPDLLIVDLLLPGLSGSDLITALRGATSPISCPIVVCSVLDRHDYPEAVDAALPKPYSRREVEQLLERLLPVR